MKLGGIVTTFFIITGIVLAGWGVYLASVKDEDSIDVLVGEVRALRADWEVEKKTLSELKAEILLEAAAMDLDKKPCPELPKPPPLPSTISVNEKVSVDISKPIKVEIIERPKREYVRKAKVAPKKPGPKKKVKKKAVRK